MSQQEPYRRRWRYEEKRRLSPFYSDRTQDILALAFMFFGISLVVVAGFLYAGIEGRI
jgi:hypothetical protein